MRRFLLPLLFSASALLLPADEVLDTQLKTRQGTFFVLTQLTTDGEVISLPQRPVISMTLTAPGRLGGSAGVNGYFGSFTTGSQNQIYWNGPGFATTLMIGPPESMELEGRFLKTFAATQYAYPQARSIIFVSEDERNWLEFSERTPEQAISQFVGSKLRLSRLVVDSKAVAIPSSTRASIEFGPDNRVAGNAGVNSFSGPFRLEADGKVQLGPNFATTRMAGPPEAMALEMAFLQALTEVTKVSVTETGVLFSNANRSVLMEFLGDF